VSTFVSTGYLPTNHTLYPRQKIYALKKTVQSVKIVRVSTFASTGYLPINHTLYPRQKIYALKKTLTVQFSWGRRSFVVGTRCGLSGGIQYGERRHMYYPINHTLYPRQKIYALKKTVQLVKIVRVSTFASTGYLPINHTLYPRQKVYAWRRRPFVVGTMCGLSGGIQYWRTSTHVLSLLTVQFSWGRRKAIGLRPQENCTVSKDSTCVDVGRTGYLPINHTLYPRQKVYTLKKNVQCTIFTDCTVFLRA
jgi:hypothetical protein